MLGIVLAAHYPLADSMKQVLEHIVGPMPDIAVVNVPESVDTEVLRQELADKIISVNEGQGVVVVTDIYGGVPSNLAVSLSGKTVRVISGMNVPMLVKLVRLREKGLDEALHEAVQAGAAFILQAEKES